VILGRGVSVVYLLLSAHRAVIFAIAQAFTVSVATVVGPIKNDILYEETLVQI